MSPSNHHLRGVQFAADTLADVAARARQEGRDRIASRAEQLSEECRALASEIEDIIARELDDLEARAASAGRYDPESHVLVLGGRR